MLYMFLADGFEETEAIATLDIIKRAGIDIQTVGIDKKEVTGSHNITVKCDILKEEVKKDILDGVILPGGMPGTLNLQKDLFVEEIVLYANENKKLVAAICAAPMILGELGVLEDKMATCYPGFETHFCGGRYTGELVQVCENVITGKGAGAALFFGAEIVEYFKPQLGKELLEEMQCFAD